MSGAQPAHRKVVIHYSLAALWALLTVPTVLLWRNSILWVAFMSIYALIAQHVTAAGAARAEQEAES
ncbi:hypothetical protein [Streptomyces sp. NRRL S-1022]|uniref:hypothetical protein n=1 Tax=Streptomyces sp. NRRL S-1022 TaxID=1463880 RepID=UPI00055E221D|nr:hypothetical protein [Streptomyces sp. NRRL S-1022]